MVQHWNIERKRQGSYEDIPLNKLGKEQAIKLSIYLQKYRLSKHNIDCIWTSPLLRAYKTAEIKKNI